MHIDDVVAAVIALLDIESWRVGRVALVGPSPMTVREYLTTLRQAMGLKPAPFLPVPPRLLNMAARVGDRLPSLLLDRPTLAMLERGNTANPAATRAVLGREPRPPWHFVAAGERSTVASRARLNWLLPLLRLSIAVLWIVTGIVSLAAFPLTESYALLARVGIVGTMAPIALGGAAAINIALGIATLVARSRRLWWTQIVVILGYTLLITWRLPEFWLHPYGPVLKNIPILAMLVLMLELEER